MSKKKIIITIIILIIALLGLLVVRPHFNKNKEIVIKVDNKGNVLTSKGAKIPSDEYSRLLSYYEDFEIDKMNDKDVIAAWEHIDNNFYCIIKENLYSKMIKGVCQDNEELYHCYDDGISEYVKAIDGKCD